MKCSDFRTNERKEGWSKEVKERGNNWGGIGKKIGYAITGKLWWDCCY